MGLWKIVDSGGTAHDTEDYGFFVNRSLGAGLPEPQNVMSDYALDDGAYYQRTVIPPRVFTLTGWLVGSSLLDYHQKRQSLIALLNRDRGATVAPVTIRYVYNSVTLDIACYYEGGLAADGELKQWAERLALRFAAPDPFWKSATQTTTALNFGTSIGAAANTTVTNGGDARCFPVIEVTGPGEILQIKNSTTAKTLALGVTLTAGEIVTFDLSPGAKTVTSSINGNMAAYLTVPGDIGTWCLMPGANTISTAISNAGAAAEVQFYDTFWSTDGVG